MNSSSSWILAALCCTGLLFAGDDRVVAVVNGQPITAAELDTVTKKQLQALEEQVRRLRESALKKLIDNKLLEQAAGSEKLLVEDYLRRNVESVLVSQAEVDAAYGRSEAQFPGILPPEVKYRIRRTLEDNRRADSLRAILERLRAQAHIENYLRENSPSGADLEVDQAPSIGAANAPVTIVEFVDFECPFCRSAQAPLRRVLAKWPGQVRLVVKHFPLDPYPNAPLAAMAAVCAERQGLFWVFHDRALQPSQDLTRPGLRALGASIGARENEFEDCLGSPSAEARVRRDIAAGRAAGVQGTPTLFVNRVRLSGIAELEATVSNLISHENASTAEANR